MTARSIIEVMSDEASVTDGDVRFSTGLEARIIDGKKALILMMQEQEIKRKKRSCTTPGAWKKQCFYSVVK